MPFNLEAIKSWARSESGRKTLTYSLFALLLAVMFHFHWSILKAFNFKYTDMDQLLMWYGVDEMRQGRFHMPRYFGQSYGTMLEAWLAIPFSFGKSERLLPIVSYCLLIIPYFIVGIWTNLKSRKPGGLVLPIIFLALMPMEYIMLGAMPRDMVSGVFVTSLALPFALSDHKWARLGVGFFSLAGWTFNSNAAVLAAVVLTFAFLESLKRKGGRLQSLTTLVVGCVLGLGVHLMFERFVGQHPEMIVHHQWSLKFKWDLWLDGLANLDRHFKFLVPAIHGQGIIYPILITLLLLVSANHKKWSVFFSTAALATIVLISLGINKVHNGTDSVFFSYERMFLALPVASVFLLSRIKLSTNVALLSLLAIAFILPQLKPVRTIAKAHYNSREHMLSTMPVKHLKRDCATLENLSNNLDAEFIIYGPGKVFYPWMMSRGCPCLTSIPMMVRPEYERKTWDMRKLDTPEYSRFLWFSPELSEDDFERFDGITVTRFNDALFCETAFLIEGQNLNPIEMYAALGYEVSMH